LSGYGKVEPRTPNGRLFTVIYGFLGIPVTVILLTNLGRYLEGLTQRVKRIWSKTDPDDDTISGTTLFFIMILYLVSLVFKLITTTFELHINRCFILLFVLRAIIQCLFLTPENASAKLIEAVFLN
ncbi:hypothetical protein OESDEN_08602, partial [Oesophagostomum dentatum]